MTGRLDCAERRRRAGRGAPHVLLESPTSDGAERRRFAPLRSLDYER